MSKEADSQALSILTQPGFKKSKIVQKTLCRFLGVDAADIEYTGTNDSLVDRHGIERLWIRDGKTLMLRYSTPADQWSRESLKTFHGLADSTSDH
jgi:hypothetical protein